jgi:AAA+ superfamily predicted ATPase
MLFDASLLPSDHDAHQIALRACARDAAMLGTVLVIDYRSAPSSLPVIDTLSFFEFIGAPFVAIVDRRLPVGSWERTAIDLPIPTLAQREQWWRILSPNSDTSLARTATHLEPDDIQSWSSGGTPTLRMNAKKSSSRVQVITPEVRLDDVIVETHVRQQLEALADRVRHRSVVLDEWRMRPGGGRGRGVTALFAGVSGTGKSMSAEALAGELGVPLFRVELASVVDKYIGETEKNLEEVFRSVENDDGVLLFDEADALFGKRSDVSDARDRYANIEVAYLLQRIEQFDGLAILTTNLRANLDEAFQRRLDAIVDFEEPDADARFTIWARALGPFEGSVADNDLRMLAAVDITGGSIRSAVVTAAYYAAAKTQTIAREHLLRGLQEEWRKAGRLNFPSKDFVDWR